MQATSDKGVRTASSRKPAKRTATPARAYSPKRPHFPRDRTKRAVPQSQQATASTHPDQASQRQHYRKIPHQRRAAFLSDQPTAKQNRPTEPSSAFDVCGPKGPEWFGASLTMEDHMKLVSRFEAASRSTAELHGLFREAFNAFAGAPRGSEVRRAALSSLENIEDELASRTLGI
jgi:hypothetical protein